MPNLTYDAPLTVAEFMRSDAFGRLIAGPVGSGKTTGSVIELLRRSTEQKRAPDGFRYTRHAVIRQTLKQLKDTVLRDCDTWISANGMGHWKVSEGTYHVEFDDVRSEWVFIPLEDAADQARLLSMQLTGAWLSEAIEMNLDVLGPITGRLGRYPSGNKGNPTWFGWIADTNFPTEMTPWHTFMENPPGNVQIFKQPSGVSAEAENLNWLVQTDETRALPIDHPVRIAQGRRYYERFIETYGADSDWVKRYVYAQYGEDPSGEAVFKNSFRSDFHITNKKIDLIPGYPIILAQDFGRNPWTLICQPDHMGRLVVHQEIAATNIGLEKHINEHVRPVLLNERFFGFKMAMVGDPAGVAKDSHSEETSFDLLRRLGFFAQPAPTNDIDPRLRAVEALLTRSTNGGPSLIISRDGCPWLCRAMSGGYRFAKSKNGALKVVPDKNDKEGFSHVADCLQYACLVVHGGMVNFIMAQMRGRTRNIVRKNPSGWT